MDLGLIFPNTLFSASELAGRYHGIHQALAGYREQYVAIHRRVHGTNAAAFQTRQPPPVKAGTPLPKLSGPSPFSAPRYMHLKVPAVPPVLS